jgi:acyl carrier protein
MTDIEIKLKNIIAKQLGISINQITMESKFVDELGGDSLDTVEMLLAIEDEFGIEITEEHAENMSCLRDVTNYLDQQLSS